MERGFLQLIKEKLTSLDKFPLLNYHKTLNCPFLFPSPPSPPSLKFWKTFPSTNMSCLKSWSLTPLYKGEGGKYAEPIPIQGISK